MDRRARPKSDGGERRCRERRKQDCPQGGETRHTTRDLSPPVNGHAPDARVLFGRDFHLPVHLPDLLQSCPRLLERRIPVQRGELFLELADALAQRRHDLPQRELLLSPGRVLHPPPYVRVASHRRGNCPLHLNQHVVDASQLALVRHTLLVKVEIQHRAKEGSGGENVRRDGTRGRNSGGCCRHSRSLCLRINWFRNERFDRFLSVAHTLPYCLQVWIFTLGNAEITFV
mmetsp:Transcript_7785/g.16196  ORF Transcript_7785/g.16196 Transcript_7785/m.16196 type:complete len:230 (+) Transcript_7785:115-804(+)